MQTHMLSFYMPTTPGWGLKGHFSEEGHVAYQMKRKEV